MPMLSSGLLLALLSPQAAAGLPVGTEIPEAVVVDITDEGFDGIGNTASALIPSDVPIPPIYVADDSETCVFGLCFTWYAYDIDVTNGNVQIDTSYFDLSPGAGAGGGAVINIDASVDISVNESASPLNIYADLVLAEIPITEDCDVWVNPVPVGLAGSIELAIVGGVLDATVPPLVVDTSQLGSEDITISNCFIGDVEDVLNFFGLSIFDLILGTVQSEIESAVADFGPEIEVLLEDAFASATIEESLDLAGVPLTLSLAPSAIEGATEGLRLSLAGSFDTPKNPCIDSYDIDGSLQTPSVLPAIGDSPGNLPFTTHLGIYADDDFVNNALFALWYGGLLCYTIDDESELDLPLAINTTLLGLLAPGVYDELLPEIVPMSIVTRPKVPPTLTVGGSNDANVIVDDLGLELVVELDGRKTRLVNIDMDVDAGVDLNFDGTTGELGIDVLFDGSRVTPAVTFNEFTPEANATIEASFLGLFDQIVGPILGDALAGLAFPLPAFEGLGLTNLEVQPAGSSDDRLGVYASLGQAEYYDPYAPAGCGCGGTTATGSTTGTGGCDTGCDSGRAPAPAFPLLFPLAFTLLRRRRG